MALVGQNRHAGAAAAALLFLRRVDRQGQVDQQFAEEKLGACFAIEDQRMFAGPA